MQPNQSFFQKNKKSIIILSVIFLIFILVLYFLFFNKKTDTGLAEGKLPQDSSFSFSKLFGLNSKNNNSNTNNSNNNSNTNNNSTDQTQNNYYREGLIQVWSKPVAGYSYYYQNNSYIPKDPNDQGSSYTKSVLIFVDSNTGFIYEKNLLDPTSTPIQISNSSYPNVYRAFFLNDDNGNKDRVVIQYLENGTIKTKIARIPTYSGLPDDLINVTNLSDNISYITTSPDNKNLLYIVSKTKITNKKQDVYSDWYLIKDSDITYGSKIYTSELTDWKLNITNNDDIYAFNTDTAHEMSNIYKLNIDNNNNLEKVFNGITGTSFIINQNNILISMNTSSGVKDYFGNNNSGNISLNNLTNLNFITLSNKCAISDTVSNFVICGVPKEIKNYDTGLPDAWYQGFTSWDDNIYIANNDYSLGAKLFDINKDASVFDSIDMKNLKINNTNSHLGFINKNDGSLWTLNIDNILNNDQVGD